MYLNLKYETQLRFLNSYNKIKKFENVLKK